jgi:DNA-binding transcriptional LysR family regulator
MVDEGVDIAIRIGTLADSNFQAIAVGRVKQIVCASPNYLARRGSPSLPSDLKGPDIISAAGITPSSAWRFEHAGVSSTTRVRTRLTCNSNRAAIDAAVGGFGITRVLSYMVEDHLVAGRLNVLLSQFMGEGMPISVVHHEGRRSASKVRGFIDFAVATLRADLGHQN